MALDLDRLEQAAARYRKHREVKKAADPEVVKREEEKSSERHRELFVPASEKLTELLAAARHEAMAVGAEAKALVRMPAADVVPLPGWTAGELHPEVLTRDNDLRPIRFLHLALLVARSVGRIRIADREATSEGDATGFMIAPNLMMTNHHVLKSSEFAAAASIVFDDEETLTGDLKETRTFRLRPDLLFVNDEELDYAIVQVSSRNPAGAALAQYGYLRLFKQTGKLDPHQRESANIIQHPGGGSKKITLRDNYIEPVVPDGIDPERSLTSLFYGTDTLKGSSGAPVCSDQWYVVGLHRGGVPATRLIDGRYVAVDRLGQPLSAEDSPHDVHYLTNEGTRISRILHSLEEKSGADSHAAEAQRRITAVATDPRTGPVDLRTAPLVLPALPAAQLGGPEEITRRSLAKFEGATGYQPGFLGRGRRISLPGETSEVQRELATLKESTSTELKYDHYSLKMNRERRTAFYVAANIDGAQLWNAMNLGTRPARPAWSYDPRMEEAWQPDDTIFSNTMQRGHLFKREDAGWGEDRDAIIRADQHSFTITNATPMMANFNNVEWGDLEDIVTRECDEGNKVSYFAGPIFRSGDPFFNELRASVSPAERFQGMRVPQAFWKIVAWVEGRSLKSAGFILVQTDEISAHGPITEEINFGTYRKTLITTIEEATGLRFPELVAVDTYGDDDGNG